MKNCKLPIGHILSLALLSDATELLHMSDSIQGTDYIATYFFLNLKVSRAKIENLKWRIGGDIIPLTFGKFVTLLVQKLKTLRKKTDM